MKIAQRITGLFLLVSLVPLILVTLFAYQSSRQMLSAEMTSKLQLAIDSQAQRITAILVNNSQFGQGLVNRYELRAALGVFLKSRNEADRLRLVQLLVAAGDGHGLHCIVVMDPDGQVLVKVGFDTADGVPQEVPPDEKRAYPALKAASLAPVVFQDQISGEARIFSGSLVRDGETPLGYIGAEFHTDELLAIVSDYSGLGSSGETGLLQRVEAGGAQYVLPLRFNADAAFTPVAEGVNGDVPALRSLDEIAAVARGTDYRGVDVVAAVRYIDIAGLGIYVKMDQAEVFAPLALLAWYFTGVIFAGSIVAILAATYFARFLTRPIAILTEAALRIQAGNLETKTGIQSRDEIGTLAATIDHMSETLLERNRELEEDINERKLAEEKLVKRTSELERLNKVMMDREMRVVELKRKLAGKEEPEQML